MQQPHRLFITTQLINKVVDEGNDDRKAHEVNEDSDPDDGQGASLGDYFHFKGISSAY